MESIIWKYHLCILFFELWMSLVFIFLVSFLKFNSGFIKLILEIAISFQELCISNTDYKASVPGSNPANASISS
jgi:hypothetical protein